MSDWIDIAGITVICIGIFIFVPILLYFCYQFHSMADDSNVEIIQHREEKLIYYMNILSILSLLLERPYVIFINVLSILPCIPRWSVYITDSVAIWSVFLLFTIKSWLLYYNFQYQLSISKIIWKKEINPRYRSWYILNKQKYGNFNYCIRLIMIPFLLYILLETFIEYFLLKNLFIHSMVLLSLLFIFPSFILYKKLNEFNDIYGIKKEIFYQQILIVTLIIILLIEFIFKIIIISYRHTLNINIPKLVRTEYLFNTMIASIVLFAMSFISTWYSLKLQHEKMKTNLSYLQKKMAKEVPSSTPTSGNPANGSSESMTTNKSGVKAMLEFISQRKGFNDFMQHLVREFATENLLFICEYIQIKYDYQVKCHGLVKIRKPKYFNNDMINDIDESDEFITIDFNANILNSDIDSDAFSYLFSFDCMVLSIIKLPAGLPKSEVLNEEKEFIDRLYKLYMKYITSYSIHAINISYSHRQSLCEIFDNLHNDNKNELECNMFNVMDEACLEILQLMSHSFARFVSNNTKHTKSDKSHNKNLELVTTAVLRNGTSYSKLCEQYNNIKPLYVISNNMQSMW